MPHLARRSGGSPRSPALPPVLMLVCVVLLRLPPTPLTTHTGQAFSIVGLDPRRGQADRAAEVAVG